MIQGVNIEPILEGSYNETAWWMIFLAFACIPVALLILIVFDTIPFFWIILWVLILLASDLLVAEFLETFLTLLTNDIRWIFFLWFTFLIRLVKRYVFLIDPKAVDVPDTKVEG